MAAEQVVMHFQVFDASYWTSSTRIGRIEPRFWHAAKRSRCVQRVRRRAGCFRAVRVGTAVALLQIFLEYVREMELAMRTGGRVFLDRSNVVVSTLRNAGAQGATGAVRISSRAWRY